MSGVVDAAKDLGGKLITGLPAQFLVLCLVNVLFIGGVLWFLDRENATRIAAEEHAIDARERVLVALLTNCIGSKAPAP